MYLLYCEQVAIYGRYAKRLWGHNPPNNNVVAHVPQAPPLPMCTHHTWPDTSSNTLLLHLLQMLMSTKSLQNACMHAIFLVHIQYASKKSRQK